MIWKDPTARRILGRLNDLENYPDDALVSYEEFTLDEKVYYFTPGGFLYRKDSGAQEIGGFFCGYLTDEVWHSRTDPAGRLRSALAKHPDWAA